MRFKNDRESALEIIRHLVDKEPIVPRFQYEMNVENKDLDETKAGRAVNQRLIEEKEKHKREKKDLEDNIKKALKEKDDAYAQKLLDAQDENMKQMQQLEHAQQELKVSSERLLKEKEEQIALARKEMQELRENVQKQEKEHAVEMERRNNKEKELKEQCDQLSKGREEFEERLVENTAGFLFNMNEMYKDIIDDQETKYKALATRMQQIKQQQDQPPPYPGQVPAQQLPPQIVYYQPPPPPPAPAAPFGQDTTMAAGAIGGGVVAGTLLSTAALGACTVM
jgi:myosin heavy subunit